MSRAEPHDLERGVVVRVMGFGWKPAHEAWKLDNATIPHGITQVLLSLPPDWLLYLVPFGDLYVLRHAMRHGRAITVVLAVVLYVRQSVLPDARANAALACLLVRHVELFAGLIN